MYKLISLSQYSVKDYFCVSSFRDLGLEPDPLRGVILPKRSNQNAPPIEIAAAVTLNPSSFKGYIMYSFTRRKCVY